MYRILIYSNNKYQRTEIVHTDDEAREMVIALQDQGYRVNVTKESKRG